MTNARDFLNRVLTTDMIEGAGADSHGGWYAAQKAKLDDPTNPFRGYGPKRLRVRDLSADSLTELGIALDANPGADVYHPLFRSWAELDADTKNKNVPPLAVLCYAIGDFKFFGNESLKELAQTLEGVISGEDTESIDILTKVNHLAFQCQELRVGSRGYGDNKRDDFPLFASLGKDVAALDEYTLMPAAKWLLAQVRSEIANS